MSEALSPIDSVFLELEQGDECSHMHIGATLVFDPVPDGGAPSVEQVRAVVRSRLHLMPHYTQRLSVQRVRPLEWPEWIDDPDFDLNQHVRHATLPAPGDDRALLEWVSDAMSHRLDRARPLWEITLVDGLAGDRWALVTKTHHCMVDGVSSMDIGQLLLDATPEPSDPPPAPGPQPAPERSPSWFPASLAARGVHASIDVARHPLARARHMLRRSLAAADVFVRDEVIPAPATSLNCEIGASRNFDVVAIDLDRIKAIKRALGGTVNDVVLALCAGGLRDLLLWRGEELPRRPLRAMVPVNLRGADQHTGAGNLVSTLYVDLPVAIEDPRKRYEQILDHAERLKSGDAALGAATVVDAVGLAPPVVHGLLARSLVAPRLFNLTITNVPGPQFPLYSLGARMREVMPLVPLFAGHAVGIAVVSYDGRVFFGLNADRRSVDDLDVLTRGIETAQSELEAIVGAEVEA